MLSIAANALHLWIVKTTQKCLLLRVPRVTATTYGAKSASRRSLPTALIIRVTGRLSWSN